MSTKIYDAYLWNDTIENLVKYLKRLKTAFIVLASNHLYKFKPYINDKKEDGYFNFITFLEDKIRRGFNEPLNISFSVVVYFHKGQIAVQFFGLDNFLSKHNNKILRMIINGEKRFIDYSYWNNTDEPENINYIEWKEREKFWDFLDIPTEDGLVYEFCTPFVLYLIDQRYKKLEYEGLKNE